MFQNYSTNSIFETRLDKSFENTSTTKVSQLQSKFFWNSRQKFKKVTANVSKTHGNSFKNPRQQFQKPTAEVSKSHGGSVKALSWLSVYLILTMADDYEDDDFEEVTAEVIFTIIRLLTIAGAERLSWCEYKCITQFRNLVAFVKFLNELFSPLWTYSESSIYIQQPNAEFG